ncbi:DUF2490 domain-containing protein [Winogradskyella aurantia]|uniref:DUF2490 domain-containing protein n=1 Tax=Winogradskyella aurantia TaxID=1915063 RepID=A0A265UZ49_9FLAO|nr:DUF2490 domain-containing protein [Winogradskyella aurantia]OZV70608.1 hypothetical protein CA834_00385 [Winogradskyella aurantia]
MSMSYTNALFIIFFLCSGFSSYSQEVFATLGESSVAINHNVTDVYKVNFTVNSRYYLYRDNDFGFENRQIDLIHFSTLNLAYNQSISLGVQYRIREGIDGGNNELRFTQQYNFTERRFALRFGHRFRLEERFFNNITFFRTRYRFALDFPLNGERLDIGECYVVGSTEALLSLSKKTNPRIGYRITGQLGWVPSKSLKIQGGLEYRFINLNITRSQNLFILTSAILNI